MQKIKNIAIPAAFGFALSFFISLIATHRLGNSLLRAIIFGLIFAILAAVIDFVYERFLNEGAVVDVPTAEGGRGDSRSGTGNRIDITIDDADLTQDEANLPFAVNKMRHPISEEVARKLAPVDVMAGQEPAGSEPPQVSASLKKAAEGVVKEQLANGVGQGTSTVGTGEASASQAFQPVALGKPLEDAVPKKEEKTAELSPAAAQRKAERTAEKKEIDALPDLDTFDDADDEDSVDKDDVIKDSEFAEDGGNPSTGDRVVFADGTKAKDHDTETLAKAIQTILRRED